MTAVEECSNCEDDGGDGAIDEGGDEPCAIDPGPVPLEPAEVRAR